MRRRQFACAASLFLSVHAVHAERGTRGSPRPIALTARKFSFSETLISAFAGESIRLEIASLDFMHGFALPQLGVRVDTPPGRTTPLVLTDLQAGRYAFLCDNFCGEAHDRMTGALVVTSPSEFHLRVGRCARGFDRRSLLRASPARTVG